MHIRLAMLARNEAERLPAIAAKLGDRIQSVVLLVDDRTDDATIEVAESLWGHLDGAIFPHTFKDFGSARNALLDVAREGCDYLLLLDPDSPLEGAWPDELTEPVYECEWRYGGIVWTRVVLLRSDQPASFEGAAHEVIDVHGPLLTDCWVDAVVTADADRLKWIADVLYLDAGANPRSAFYLAQTLKDLGRLDEAFGWYMRRAAMGEGWVEETYMAVYEAAHLLNRLDYDLAADLWRRCINLMGRCEPFYMLACQANERGMHSEALAWASQGLQLPPTRATLFVNRWIEQEGLQQQFALAAKGLLPAGAPLIEAAPPMPLP